MKHLIKQFVLAMIVSLTSFSASAYTFTVDGFYYDVVSLSDLTCEVVKGDVEYAGDVTIPATVKYNGRTLTVVGIGGSAFRNCTSLTSVNIPSSVTDIGIYAFDGCENLNAVYITDLAAWCNINFSDWHSNPLCYAGNLYIDNQLATDITIPNSVTYIGGYAFFGCTSLTSVVIPNSVTYIVGAFCGCTSLSSVVIPNSVTYIGGAFRGCTSLSSVVIPNSVGSIESYTFAGCTSLSSVVIPNSVGFIGDYAFSDCTSLTSVVIPNSVTDIYERAFWNCTNLTSVVIGNGVIDIYSDAFWNCTSLTSVVIGNGVTSIGDDAFGSCTNLTQMEIGNEYTMKWWLRYGKESISTLIIAEDYKDTNIPTYSYYKDASRKYYISEKTNLKTFISKTATSLKLGDDFLTSQYLNLEVIVPTASLAAYQAADVWKDFWCLKGGAENYGSTTGIESVQISTPTDGKKQDVIYDISGRRLKAPQRGLNIINGKKVVVK